MNRNLTPRLCACGCGDYAAVDNRRNRVSKYIAGHNGRVFHGMKGKAHTPENCHWITRAENNARRIDPGGWIKKRNGRPE